MGRTNRSEERTILVAKDAAPDGYQANFVLSVSSENDGLPRGGAEGVDAILATGTAVVSTSAVTVPAANGLVGRGANGVVGYVHAAARSQSHEQSVQAGVLGTGGADNPGVFGQGSYGVIGYSAGVPRDLNWELQNTGGVSGRSNGFGVCGKGDGGGVFGFAPGDAAGVRGDTEAGWGVHGRSASGNGGVFESRSAAQLMLLPNPTDRLDPEEPLTPNAVPVGGHDRFGPKLPKGGQTGQLAALQDAGTGHCTLWLCVADPDPATATAATWAQVLVGSPFKGRG
ncbi:hypothetical protein GCM10009665_64080 [Kitasatospora nipponensis]|uniref:Uncharacterized protein n=1 Tax=Kitasatospora nipponensis TaxID=258049 RepID=A0ABP4HHA3_9ACTN